LEDADTMAGVTAAAPAALRADAPQAPAPRYLYSPDLAPTLGQWGSWRQETSPPLL
jgi:hypothetical protein